MSTRIDQLSFRQYAIIWQALTDYVNSGKYAPDNMQIAEDLAEVMRAGIRGTEEVREPAEGEDIRW